MPASDNSYIQSLFNDVKKYLTNKPIAPVAPKPGLPNINVKNNPGGTAGPFRNPVPGSHNSGGFDPTGKGSVGRIHKGLDLRAPGGTTIFPIAAGIVTKVQKDSLGGNTVVIEHPGNYKSYYAHMGTITVKPNQKVSLETKIGTVGDSGNAAGFPHLHLQVWSGGSLIDPASVFNYEKQTVFNAKTEKLWNSDAKQIAKNWSMTDHLNTEKKPVMANDRLDAINKLADLYEALCFKKPSL